MEDLYPIAEEGPKYRGKQSIKLRRRFEREGDGLNAQLGRTFHKKKKKKFGRPTWVDTPRGYLHARRSANIRCMTGVFFRKRGFANTFFLKKKWPF